MNPVIAADLIVGRLLVRGMTLAQGSFFQAPEPLEEDGGLAAILFERPWVVAGAMAVLALVAFLTLNRQEKGRLGAMVGGALLLAGVAAAATGMAVETARERVRARTLALVEATGRIDTASVAAALDDEVDLLMGGQRVPGVGRQVILSTLGTLEGRFALEEARALTTRVRVDDASRARTQVQVRATPQGGAPSLSWWLINWTKDDRGGWAATRIDCLLFNGRTPSPAWMP